MISWIRSATSSQATSANSRFWRPSPAVALHATPCRDPDPAAMSSHDLSSLRLLLGNALQKSLAVGLQIVPSHAPSFILTRNLFIETKMSVGQTTYPAMLRHHQVVDCAGAAIAIQPENASSPSARKSLRYGSFCRLAAEPNFSPASSILSNERNNMARYSTARRASPPGPLDSTRQRWSFANVLSNCPFTSASSPLGGASLGTKRE